MSFPIEHSTLSRKNVDILKNRGFLFVSDVIALPASKLASQCGITARSAQSILNTLKTDAAKPQDISKSQLPDVFKQEDTVDLGAFQTRMQALTRTSHYGSGLSTRQQSATTPGTFDESLHPSADSGLGAAVRAGTQAEKGDGACTALQLLETIQAQNTLDSTDHWSTGGDDAGMADGGMADAAAYGGSADLNATLVTLSQALDTLLRGGIPFGMITEVAGVPGVGKSQLGMQVALAATFPVRLGGAGARAVILDCEGGVRATRLHELATHLCNTGRRASYLTPLAYTQRYYELVDAPTAGPDAPLLHLRGTYTTGPHAGQALDELLPLQDPAPDLCPRALLSRVRVARVLSGAQLVASVRALAAEAAATAAARAAGSAGNADMLACVVVDSVAVHFRAERADGAGAGSRGELNVLAKELRALASLGVAVLCLNQVTTKAVPAAAPAMASYANFGQPLPPSLAGPSTVSAEASQVRLTLAPALGRAWASVPQLRVLLHWHGDHRAAVLSRAPWSRRERSASHAFFAVDERGVRDIGAPRPAEWEAFPPDALAGDQARQVLAERGAEAEVSLVFAGDMEAEAEDEDAEEEGEGDSAGARNSAPSRKRARISP